MTDHSGENLEIACGPVVNEVSAVGCVIIVVPPLFSRFLKLVWWPGYPMCGALLLPKGFTDSTRSCGGGWGACTRQEEETKGRSKGRFEQSWYHHVEEQCFLFVPRVLILLLFLFRAEGFPWHQTESRVVDKEYSFWRPNKASLTKACGRHGNTQGPRWKGNGIVAVHQTKSRPTTTTPPSSLVQYRAVLVDTPVRLWNSCDGRTTDTGMF